MTTHELAGTGTDPVRTGDVGYHFVAEVHVEDLTSRELDVLMLFGRGFTIDQVALRLFLSPNTVKTYVQSLYRRIGATSRTDAVIWYFLHRLHESPAPRDTDSAPAQTAPKDSTGRGV